MTSVIDSPRLDEPLSVLDQVVVAELARSARGLWCEFCGCRLHLEPETGEWWDNTSGLPWFMCDARGVNRFGFARGHRPARAVAVLREGEVTS